MDTTLQNVDLIEICKVITSLIGFVSGLLISGLFAKGMSH